MEITGQILKENREKAGLSINEVAVATKINVKVLEAMEAGQKENLPAMTFLRGFVRTYAKYLKLDEESIMQTFYEEMGTSKPQQLQKAKEVNEDQNGEALFSAKSLTSKVVAVASIIVLIVLILFIRQIVNKYEKEAQVLPAEDIKEIVEQQVEPSVIDNVVEVTKEDASTTGKEEAELAQNEKAPEVVKAEELAKPETKTVEKVSDRTKIAETDIETSDVEETEEDVKPKIVEKPVISPVVPVKPKEEPKPVVAEKKPEIKAEAPKIEEVKKTVDEKKLVKNPQEVIIEALDNTQFSFTIDEKNNYKISLKASEIHVIKANSSVALSLADGGAVSLTHNGRKKGVPGDLGRSLQLKFP